MSTPNELTEQEQRAQDLIDSVTDQKTLSMGYTWDDLSPECKALAIDLADLLKISKIEAYKLLVEKMKVSDHRELARGWASNAY